MTYTQQIFYNIKYGIGANYKKLGHDLDYCVIVDHDAKEVILQFCGSNSTEDWIHNFSFLPWLVRLGNKYKWTTHGYAVEYSSGYDIPMLEYLSISNTYPEYRRVMRGHSLGSAMVKLAAIHYYNIVGEYVDEIITFGDVKCLLNPFIKAQAVIANEYVTPNDFVTWQVPFFHRNLKSKKSVGPKFQLRELFRTPYYHMNYETYDYGEE